MYISKYTTPIVKTEGIIGIFIHDSIAPPGYRNVNLNSFSMWIYIEYFAGDFLWYCGSIGKNHRSAREWAEVSESIDEFIQGIGQLFEARLWSDHCYFQDF